MVTWALIGNTYPNLAADICTYFWPIFSSGLAACSAVVHLLNSGEHMIAMDDLYGGSNRLFRKVVAPKMNIETSFVDMTEPEKVRLKL